MRCDACGCGYQEGGRGSATVQVRLRAGRKSFRRFRAAVAWSCKHALSTCATFLSTEACVVLAVHWGCWDPSLLGLTWGSYTLQPTSCSTSSSALSADFRGQHAGALKSRGGTNRAVRIVPQTGKHPLKEALDAPCCSPGAAPKRCRHVFCNHHKCHKCSQLTTPQCTIRVEIGTHRPLAAGGNIERVCRREKSGRVRGGGGLDVWGKGYTK